MIRALTAAVCLLLAAAGMNACTPPDYSKCPTKGSGQVRVAVVVDARALGGKTDVVCVVVPSASNGLDALRARATRIGTAAPRLNQGGLVCAIDARPAAPACGENGPNGPEYWSYWLGGGGPGLTPGGPGRAAGGGPS